MSKESQAFPLHEGPSGDVYPGLTKREYFAAAALTGLCAFYDADQGRGFRTDECAHYAVETADALIRELSKEPPE